MDWDYWIRAAKQTEIGFNPQPIANYREYKNSKTFKGGTARMKEIRYLIDKYGSRKYPRSYINFYLDTIYKKIKNISPVLAEIIKFVVKQLKTLNRLEFYERN